MTKTLEEKIKLIRSPNRLTARQVIRQLISDFFEVHGDRLLGDDPALTAGIGLFHKQPVTVLGINREATFSNGAN